MTLTKKTILAGCLLSAVPLSLFAKEHPMGPAKDIDGMELASVYLQPITMDKKVGLPADKSDVHIELDIHATKDNKNTFAEGWWIPYLTVDYKIEKIDEKTHKSINSQEGELMPMIADDGPHYGKNVKLDGPGLYRVTYNVYPPSDNKKVVFGRHIDKETGAPEWFKPFNVSWEFPWAGPGEKGSY